MYTAYSPPFPSPSSTISFNIIKVSNLLNENIVEEKLLSTTDECREKDPLYILSSIVQKLF